MKKHIDKIFYLFLILFIHSCTTDDRPTVTESQSRSVRYIDGQSIPEVLGKLNESLNLISDQRTTAFNGQVKTPWGDIDLDGILEVVDTLKNTNYTFSVSDDDDNPFTFTNLIIKKRESGEVDTPFLLEYYPDSAYIRQFISDGFSIQNFSGKITKKPILINSSNSQNSTANLQNERTNINNCSEETYFSGGNTTNAPTQTNNTLTGMSISTGCYAVVYSLQEVVPNGPKFRTSNWGDLFPEEDVVVWVCTDAYSFNINENDNCPSSETEDIGVLFEGFDEFLSSLTLHQNYSGPGGIKAHLNKLWQDDLIDAHLAGFLTGMVEMIEDTWSTAELLAAWTNGLNATASQQAIKAETWQFVLLLNKIVFDSSFRNQVWETLELQFRDYIIETVNIDKQAQFNQGKILFDVATLFLGVGEIKLILKGQQLSVGILNTLSKLQKALSVPIVEAKRLGMRVFKSGEHIIIKSANGVDDVARVSYNKLRISKHQIEAKDGSVIFKEASEANSTYPSNWDPPYSPDLPVTDFLTSGSQQFVRIYKQGVTNKVGAFMVKASDIDGLSPSQLKDKLALDNIPDKIVNLTVPDNFNLRTGKIASRPNGTNGGLIQFELLNVLDDGYWGPGIDLN